MSRLHLDLLHPAPFSVDIHPDRCVVRDAHGVDVCTTTGENRRANARVIAGALGVVERNGRPWGRDNGKAMPPPPIVEREVSNDAVPAAAKVKSLAKVRERPPRARARR